MRLDSSSKEDKKILEVAEDLCKKGAPYYMIVSPDIPTPKIFQIHTDKKGPSEVKFTTEM